MARNVFVLLLVAVCLLQVVLSVPRERRDAETASEAPSNILEGIERLASDIGKKTQEFFSADSLRAIQANASELANKVGAAFGSLVDGGGSTPVPA